MTLHSSIIFACFRLKVAILPTSNDALSYWIKIVVNKSEKIAMAKTFTITLPDNLEKALNAQAERLNKAPEEIVLQALLKQLGFLNQSTLIKSIETDPLLRLIGSINVDIPKLAENHDYYIGKALHQDLNWDE